MKKYFCILLGSLCVLSLMSCENSIDQAKPIKSPEYSPEQIGKLHNEILKEVDNLLLQEDNLSKIDEFSELELRLSKDIINQKLKIAYEQQSETKALIYKINRNYYYQTKDNKKSQAEANDELAQQLLIECEIMMSDDNFISSIDNREQAILKALIDSFTSYQLTKDFEALEKELAIHKDNIAKAGFNYDIGEGYLTLLTLSVAEYSIKYWTEDPETRFQGDSKIVWWAVSDAVGAVVGAGTSIVKDALNDEEIDWSDAAVDGLVTGVASSIPGGKAVKKFIKNLI